MPDEPTSNEEPNQQVERYFKELRPVRLEGAPKVHAKWSETLSDIVKPKKRLGSGTFAEVWATSRLDMPLNESPDTSGSNRHDLSPDKPSGRPEVRQKERPSYAVFAAKMLRKHERGTASHASRKTETLGEEQSSSDSKLDMAKDEAQLVMSLRHHHVVKCYGAFQNETCLVFFYEYGRGGDVGRLVREREGLTREEALSITRQILDAVNYIHSKGIIHRDIKPKNIFYKYDRKKFEDNERDRSRSHEVESRDKYLVFLGDFGLAAETADGHASGHNGTKKYMAPEVLLSIYDDFETEKYDATIDFWSLGITTYKLMTNKQPHFDRETIRSLKIEKLKLPDDDDKEYVQAFYLIDHVPKIVAKRFENDADVGGFLLGCLAVNPHERKADARMLARARSSGIDLDSGMRISEPQKTNGKGKGIREGFNAGRKWKEVLNVTKPPRASQQQQDLDKELKNQISQPSIQDTPTSPKKQVKGKKVTHKKAVK